MADTFLLAAESEWSSTCFLVAASAGDGREVVLQMVKAGFSCAQIKQIARTEPLPTVLDYRRVCLVWIECDEDSDVASRFAWDAWRLGWDFIPVNLGKEWYGVGPILSSERCCPDCWKARSRALLPREKPTSYVEAAVTRIYKVQVASCLVILLLIRNVSSAVRTYRIRLSLTTGALVTDQIIPRAECLTCHPPSDSHNDVLRQLVESLFDPLTEPLPNR